ncbi:MAG: DUF896 domain-containing protein [Acetobacterium sp.]
MITKEKIERINELANKKKMMPLSEAELEEQQALRSEYLKAIRKNCRDQLDSIIIVDEPQTEINNSDRENKIEKDEINLECDDPEKSGSKEKKKS